MADLLTRHAAYRHYAGIALESLIRQNEGSTINGPARERIVTTAKEMAKLMVDIEDELGHAGFFNTTRSPGRSF